MADFLAVAKYLVKPSGRIWFVFHPDRLLDFFHCVGKQNLALLRLRMVHGSLAAPARIFLAELAKGRKSTTTVLPPLIVYDDEGEYTSEVRAILGEGGGQ
jgi:tRNA1Val (adenine37-N6)-methyltransferase